MSLFAVFRKHYKVNLHLISRSRAWECTPTPANPGWSGWDQRQGKSQTNPSPAGKSAQDFDPTLKKRAFSPHLTIARLRQNVGRDIVRQVGETLSQFKIDSLGLFEVQTVQLFKSV